MYHLIILFRINTKFFNFMGSTIQPYPFIGWSCAALIISDDLIP